MIDMRQSKHMSSEGLSGELHAFLNPLAPLRDTLGMTFDEVKIQIERNITYGIQKLAPVECKIASPGAHKGSIEPKNCA